MISHKQLKNSILQSIHQYHLNRLKENISIIFNLKTIDEELKDNQKKLILVKTEIDKLQKSNEKKLECDLKMVEEIDQKKNEINEVEQKENEINENQHIETEFTEIIRKSIDSANSKIKEDVKNFKNFMKGTKTQISNYLIKRTNMNKEKRKLFILFLNWKSKKIGKNYYIDYEEEYSHFHSNKIKTKHKNKLCYIFYSSFKKSTRSNEWYVYVEYNSNRKYVIPIRHEMPQEDIDEFVGFKVCKCIDFCDGDLALTCLLNTLINYDEFYDAISFVNATTICDFRYVLKTFYEEYISVDINE